MQNQAPLPQGQGQGQEQPLPPQPAPQVIYIQTAPPVSKVYEKYAARTSRALGISRIVIGVLSIVLQITLIVLETDGYAYFVTSFAGTGIWCGILFIIAGSFGVGAAATKTMCMIVTNMVMAIISVSICGTSFVAVSAIGVSISADNRRYSYHYSYSNRWDVILALYSVTLILALAQVVCDIWSAVICCKAVCCGRPSANTIQTHGTMPQNAHAVCGQGQVYPGIQQQQLQQGQAYPFQQPQGCSVTYNPQTYQYPGRSSLGNATPPPAYAQEEQKQQPHGFAA